MSVQPTQAAISLSFETASTGVSINGAGAQGVMQIGNVAYSGSMRRSGVEIERRPQSFIIRTWFGLRLDNAGQPLGSACLSAFLLHPDPNHSYAIDGVRLTTSVQEIKDQVRYGITTEHRLEIETPRSVPEDGSQVAQAIGLLAAPN